MSEENVGIPGMPFQITTSTVNYQTKIFGTGQHDDAKCATPCWHLSPLQHSVMHHRDEMCCHCGGVRCVNTWNEEQERRKGHGEFMP